jgi:hypothetical protein
MVTENGGAVEEIGERLKKAGKGFGAFNRWFGSYNLQPSTKMIIVKRVLTPMAIYGLEVCPLRKEEERRLNTVHMTWLRRACNKTRWDMLTNEEIRVRCGCEIQISELIKREQLRYWGHLVRMDDSRLPKKMYRWQTPPDWRRSRGRPQMRWGDNIKHSVEELSQVAGLGEHQQGEISWPVVEALALERNEWRTAIGKLGIEAQNDDCAEFLQIYEDRIPTLTNIINYDHNYHLTS